MKTDRIKGYLVLGVIWFVIGMLIKALKHLQS